ncbi:unnamed protein product [Spirodela intermedia]|uniref:Uncharacterized protein n=1 Tax=Spirodela intermedia TaxID=51605 RepID=A0A7I8KHW8_SPIIN|nr:unnamed protein product [Spirodela intermedia]
MWEARELNKCIQSQGPADELLRPPARPVEALQRLQVPSTHQELHDVGVIPGSVDAESLRHGGEVVEQAGVPAVPHQVGRHGDLLPHHILDRQHGFYGVHLQQLLHDLGVRRLVALLVGGDGAAYPSQDGVAAVLRQPGGVAVGDEGGPLLERGVDEAQVLDGALHHAHVNPPGEIQVPGEEVPVAVLLRRPGTGPPCPGAGARPRLVADAYSSGRRSVRERRERTSSSNSSVGREESGRKSCGCQHFSTGFRSGSKDWAAQPSRDLNTSTFSGGMECWTGWRTAGAATAATAIGRILPRHLRIWAEERVSWCEERSEWPRIFFSPENSSCAGATAEHRGGCT